MTLDAKDVCEHFDEKVEEKIQKYKKLGNDTDNLYLKEWYKGKVDAYNDAQIILSNYISHKALDSMNNTLDEIIAKLKAPD